jgi:tetratricopeptide (TPR) repeat protein
MEVVESWNGRLACALQAALRMSNEAFAERLGAHVRTIAGWHENSDLVPRPDMQQALDTLLARADEGAQARFAARTSHTRRISPPDPISQPTAPLRPEMTPGPHSSIPERDAESARRALLAQSIAGDEAPPEFSLLELAETIRREMEDTLAAGTVSPARLTHIEEIIASHVRLYTTTPPTAALAGLLLDVTDLQRLVAERQPTPVQARLYEMTSMLATLAADSLMKLGRIVEAKGWYGTASMAADESGNKELRARVRAQQTMLPYYYGNPAEVVLLARDAQAILGGEPRAAGTLAAAAEARALAKMGNRAEAEAAMARAQDLAERVGEPDDDEAFRFGERRQLFYLSGALTNLADAAPAEEVQARALELYGDAPGLIDPALIRLDQAHLLVFDHDLDGACELIRQACLSLGSEYRTRVLSARVKQIDATPRDGQPRRVLDSLHRELLSSQARMIL